MLIEAYEKVDQHAFGICYDPGNIIYYTKGERRPETDIDAVASIVSSGIIKDCVVEDGVPDVMVTAGKGWLTLRRCLQVLSAEVLMGLCMSNVLLARN